MLRLVVIALGGMALSLACSESGALPPPVATVTSTPEVTLTGTHAELAALMDGAAQLPFRVVLERTAPSDVAGDRLVITNTPQATRVDTIPTGSDAPVSSLIGLADEGAVTTCQNGPDNWQCFSTESFGRGVFRTAAPFTFFPAYELERYEVEEAPGRTLAGEESICYLIEPPEEDDIEYCFTPDGVPVYSSPVFGTYQAKEIAREIPDGAFDPPAAVE